MADTALELRSLIKKSGELELSLTKVPVPEPGEDQVLVKVEATPINPSDLGLLVGPADMGTAKASDCQTLPAGTTAAEGASWFVNPLTALGMTETMKREGHKALVHTAAASNLGQMLNKICLKDGIGLVNIVRSPEQAKLLRGIG